MVIILVDEDVPVPSPQKSKCSVWNTRQKLGFVVRAQDTEVGDLFLALLQTFCVTEIIDFSMPPFLSVNWV